MESTLDIRISSKAITCDLEAAERAVRRFQRKFGARAPVRKRKGRLAKKLAKRGGFLHYSSRGARRCLGKT